MGADPSDLQTYRTPNCREHSETAHGSLSSSPLPDALPAGLLETKGGIRRPLDPDGVLLVYCSVPTRCVSGWRSASWF